jgi:hypothetical protein
MRLTRIPNLLLIAIWTVQGGVVAQETADFRLAMNRLDLSLDLNHEDGSLAGSASYEIINLSDAPVSEVPFNLGRLMTVRSASFLEGEDLEFSQDVRVFVDSPQRQVNHVVVSLPGPLAPGSEVTLRMDYSGFLVGYTETGSLYIQDRIVWNALSDYRPDGKFSILRTDAFAWPVLGTLNSRVNRVAPRPDFTFSAKIAVPEPYIVASSGKLVEQRTRDGRTSFLYESIDPVPFLNLPIAEYAVSRSPGIRVYHFPADSAGGVRILESATEGLELLASWFGPLGVTPELVVMEIPEMWGSQASLTGGIIQTADAFGEAGSMSALYHELSHLWNARDLDQPSARWNEGLATFLAHRMAESLEGSEEMEGAVQRTADRILAGVSRTPEIASVPFSRYGEAGVTDLSYRVGFLMFYSLELALGEDAFNSVMRSFYQNHKEQGWTFEGLAELLKAHPQEDFSGFLENWIYTTAWFEKLQAGIPPQEIGFQR